MSGSPATFRGGHPRVGVYGDTVFVRRGEDAPPGVVPELDARLFEPMPGRPIRGDMVLPPAHLNTWAKAAKWVRTASDYVDTLPPKTR